MPPFYAIAKILKVLAMQRVTDYYGPVIYTRFGAQGAEYVPDGQREVYMRFFDDLDQASEILSDYVAERPTAGEFAKFDLLLDGRLCELKSPTSDASGVNGLRFIERNIRKAVRQFEKAEGGPVRPSIVVLNCEEVPVTREDALKRVRLEMSRHDIDHVILLTRGGAIDDIKK